MEYTGIGTWDLVWGKRADMRLIRTISKVLHRDI